MAFDALLSAAEQADVRDAFTDLYATFQALNEVPTLTLRRRSTTTEAYTDVATFRPYSIGLLNRAEQVSGTNTGAVTETAVGRMLVAGNLTIRDDDRFVWNGATCRVTLVSPDTNLAGLRSVEFSVSGVVEAS